MLYHLIFYSHNCNVFVRILLKLQCIKLLLQYNFLHRLAHMRERGIQDRIFKQFTVSKESEEQPSTIDVSMVTVTPILVVLAAGYVIGIFVLLIERCAHGNILKCWPRGSVWRWRQNEYWRLLYNYQKSKFSSPLHVLTSFSHIAVWSCSTVSSLLCLCLLYGL